MASRSARQPRPARSLVLVDPDDRVAVVRQDRLSASCASDLVARCDDPKVLAAVVDGILLFPRDRDLGGAVLGAALAGPPPRGLHGPIVFRRSEPASSAA